MAMQDMKRKDWWLDSTVPILDFNFFKKIIKMVQQTKVSLFNFSGATIFGEGARGIGGSSRLLSWISHAFSLNLQLSLQEAVRQFYNNPVR